jgi:pimeloyl-ACP methyl ester carboxylesterase
VTWWEIEPRERRSDLISVHLHGLGASPASVLRTVEVALAAGMRAMVPDLRVPRSNLGLRESVVIGRWIEQQPASAQFVLVGWSMGAEITRHLLLSSMRTRVQSALLISPVVDWPATVGHSGRASRVPRWWMHLVLMSLRGTVVPRLVGMNEAALPLPAARCGDFPPGSVAIHSAGDKVTPLAATVRARDAGAFELHLTAAAPHTMEWNVSPQAALIAQRWFVDQLRSTRP